MLEPRGWISDTLWLAVYGGLVLAGVFALPVVLWWRCRRAGRAPTVGVWAVCIGGCVGLVFAAFAANMLSKVIRERRERGYAERVGLVRIAEGSTSDIYQSPAGWSMMMPSSAGRAGERATFMSMDVAKAEFTDGDEIVAATGLASIVAGVVFYVLTRRLPRGERVGEVE